MLEVASLQPQQWRYCNGDLGKDAGAHATPGSSRLLCTRARRVPESLALDNSEHALCAFASCRPVSSLGATSLQQTHPPRIYSARITTHVVEGPYPSQAALLDKVVGAQAVGCIGQEVGLAWSYGLALFIIRCVGHLRLRLGCR